MPEDKEEKLAGASYIMTFFGDVENLTGHGGAFINMLAVIKEKYPKSEMAALSNEGMDEADQMNLMTAVQNVRFMAFRCWVRFNALKGQITQFKSNETKINELYSKISDNPVPSKKDVEDFVVTMNELFVNGVVQEILGSAGEVLRSVS
jgi:hypothetical protein